MQLFVQAFLDVTLQEDNRNEELVKNCQTYTMSNPLFRHGSGVQMGILLKIGEMTGTIPEASPLSFSLACSGFPPYHKKA